MKKTYKHVLLTSILASTLVIPNAYAVKNGQKFKDWEGRCEKVKDKQFCGITHTIFDEDKKPVVNIFIRKIEKQPDPIAFVKVPLGVNLLAGMGVAVDQKQISQVHYTVCDPAGCNAIIPLTPDLAKKLRAGKKLQIGMYFLNKEVSLSASLSGISKALNSL